MTPCLHKTTPGNRNAAFFQNRISKQDGIFFFLKKGCYDGKFLQEQPNLGDKSLELQIRTETSKPISTGFQRENKKMPPLFPRQHLTPGECCGAFT